MKKHILAHQAIIHSRLGEGVVQRSDSSKDSREAEETTTVAGDSPSEGPAEMEASLELLNSVAVTDPLDLVTSYSSVPSFLRVSISSLAMSFNLKGTLDVGSEFVLDVVEHLTF